MIKSKVNIISHSIKNNKIGGPNKVIQNTIAGLELINQPYVLNQDLRNFKYNWIHDSIEAVIESGLTKIPVLMGPNIVVLPSNLPLFLPDISNSIYIHPSPWCVDVWNKLGYNKCELVSWPAGIDTESFKPKIKLSTNTNNVLIYFKRRKKEVLNEVITVIEKLNLNPIIIEYGKYNELQYKEALQKASFGIWIGISESQGIGLQEALANNLPLIVCDVNTLFESSHQSDYLFPNQLKKFKPTSAPYFDDSCGIIINDLLELENAIKHLKTYLQNYHPSDFIQKNLSLEKQARELMNLFLVLEDKNKEYFKNKFTETKKTFSQSLRGLLIYFSFVINRKFKTLVKIIKMKTKK